MHQPLIALLLTASLAGCAGSLQAPAEREGAVSAQAATIEQVSVKEAAAMLKADPGLTLLDVRTPAEYADVHAPGAKLHPLGELSQWAPTLDPQKRYVVICRSGSRSMQAAKQLVEHGFTGITNVQGGMLDWEKDGTLPVIRE